MPYLLDTNVFISGAKFYYPMKVFPGFWDWLEYEHKIGEFILIDRVFHELQGGDDLAIWTRERLKPVSANIREYLDVIQCADGKVLNQSGERYRREAMEKFAKCADSYLIAHAKAENCIVVTYEKDAQSPKNVKIPTICEDLQVPCITVLELLRTLNPVFTWDSSTGEGGEPFETHR